MELEPIKEAPIHIPDVPPHLLVNCPAPDRYVIETISVMKQDLAWVKEVALTGYNLAVQHDNDQTKSRRWFGKLIIGGLVGAVITEACHRIFA